MNKQKGKVAIVTGGTSGFGFAISKAFVKQGINVVISARGKTADLERIGRVLSKEGEGKVIYLKQDITAEDAAEKIVKTTVKEFGMIDIVVNNAGSAKRIEVPYFDFPLEKFSEYMIDQFKQFAVAPVQLSIAAAKIMAKKYANIGYDEVGLPKDTGCIIYNLSQSALQPIRDDLLAYSAAKRAALSSMETLAGVLGKYNIRVNAIAPGYANTAGPKKFYDRFPNIRADIDKHVSLKPNFIDPSAVVPAVQYLVADNYVNGVVISLDGGWHLRFNRYFNV